jgi:hypothetical protein
MSAPEPDYRMTLRERDALGAIATGTEDRP